MLIRCVDQQLQWSFNVRKVSAVCFHSHIRVDFWLKHPPSHLLCKHHLKFVLDIVKQWFMILRCQIHVYTSNADQQNIDLHPSVILSLIRDHRQNCISEDSISILSIFDKSNLQTMIISLLARPS